MWTRSLKFQYNYIYVVQQSPALPLCIHRISGMYGYPVKLALPPYDFLMHKAYRAARDSTTIGSLLNSEGFDSYMKVNRLPIPAPAPLPLAPCSLDPLLPVPTPLLTAPTPSSIAPCSVFLAPCFQFPCSLLPCSLLPAPLLGTVYNESYYTIVQLLGGPL